MLFWLLSKSGIAEHQQLGPDLFPTRAQARALKAALGIDWLKAPFTRCVVDNAPLEPAPLEAEAQVPPASRAAGGRLWQCPHCRRLYWPGGHLRRMQAKLAAWRET